MRRHNATTQCELILTVMASNRKILYELNTRRGGKQTVLLMMGITHYDLVQQFIFFPCWLVEAIVTNGTVTFSRKSPVVIDRKNEFSTNEHLTNVFVDLSTLISS